MFRASANLQVNDTEPNYARRAMNGERPLPMILINGNTDVPTYAVVNELVRKLRQWDIQRMTGLGRFEDGILIVQSPETYNSCYVFREFVDETPDGHAIMDRYIKTAEDRGCQLMIINLVYRPLKIRNNREVSELPHIWRAPGVFCTEINMRSETVVEVAETIAGHAKIEHIATRHW